MRFSLYSYEYGGNVLGGVIHEDHVIVTWIADKGDVSIRKDTLPDTFVLTEYSIDRLKYKCTHCSPNVNCMFGRPCAFGLPFDRTRLNLFGEVNKG